jgi:ABC-type uncharacterized transport system ATPase component
LAHKKIARDAAMKLLFSAPYKSIRFLPTVELPDFVVLTGVNGAGKSHLLQAIEMGAIQIEGIPLNHNTRNIRCFDWANLVPNDSGTFAAFQSKQERAQLWTQLSQLRANLRPQIEQLAAQSPTLSQLSIRELLQVNDQKLMTLGLPPDQASVTLQRIKVATQNINQALTNQFVQQDPHNRTRLISGLCSATSLPLIAFEEDDFYDNFPPSWQPVDMFQQSFSRLFAEYRENWRTNQFKRWRNSQGASHRVLDDQQFVDKYGPPPWEFVNSVLEAASLGFRIDEPSEIDDRPYEAVLTDQTSGTNVRFNDLSSGERVLMSFALCLYYARDSRQIVEYPQVLLFDEIDAPLHPSMTQSLLRTIRAVLVEQHKIKVILTTHSPSTVALAPEGSLFAMRKGAAERLTRTTKDSALSILMAGVPTVSISYENRRQVFVESHHDVGFYEIFYEKLKPYLAPHVSVSFIASSGSKVGGSAHVKDVVGQLSRAGNKSVFGIVDWDTSNKSQDGVMVLGQDQRYSIENYVFDPVLVAILLFLERIISREDIGLNANETHANFSKMDDIRLQSAADFVIARLSASAGIAEPGERLACRYVGGNTVHVPKWLLHMQGHALERRLRETFPQLNAFRGEAELKKAILTRVVDDVPALIPQCILDLFITIQTS